jgi:hypothetical protein
MNSRRARRAHPGTRDTLTPIDLPDTPITNDDRPDVVDRCPLRIPDTNLQCGKHTHPPTAACYITGIRDGVRFSAFFWRAT